MECFAEERPKVKEIWPFQHAPVEKQPLMLIRERQPSRPLVTDDFSHGTHRAKSKLDAATFPYNQIDSRTYLGTLKFDLDSRGAYSAVADMNGPAPNVLVLSRDTHRGHAGYVIKSPVHRYLGAASAPLYKAAAVERGLFRVLTDAGAGPDPGFAGLLTKTMDHPRWVTVPLYPHAYTLDDLAENLPAESMALERSIHRVAGLGRNCTCFDELRPIAYREVLKFKREGRSLDHFTARLLDVGSGLNLQFSTPLPASEIRSIARSVAKWTWARFTPEKFSEIQSQRGKRGAAKRWDGHTPAMPWLALKYSESTWRRRGRPAAPSIDWRAAA